MLDGFYQKNNKRLQKKGLSKSIKVFLKKKKKNKKRQNACKIYTNLSKKGKKIKGPIWL